MSLAILGLLTLAAVEAAPLVPGAGGQARSVVALAVASDRRLETEAAAATLALQQLLENDVRFQGIELSARARGETTALRAGKAERARERVEEALDLIDEMQGKAALQKATEAVSLYEEADLSLAFPGLLEAIAARAFAAHSEGWMAEAWTELARLFALRPDYELDPLRLTPELASLAEQARAKARESPRLSLAVRSLPVPALVFVDGLFRGVTPLEVGGLAPGSHYLTLSAPGYALAQTSHPAGLGTPLELSLEPAAAEAGLLQLLERLRASAPSESAEAAAALARWAGAEETLVARLSKRAEGTWAVVSRWDSQGRALGSHERALGSPEAIEELALAAFLEPNPAAGSAPPALAPAAGGLGTRRTVGLAATGAGAASLAGAIALGVSARDKAREASRIPAVEPERYDAASLSANRLALGANLLYGVAALGAGIGAWLLITGEPGSSGPAAEPGGSKREEADEFGLLLAPLEGGALFSVGGSF